MCLVEVFCFYLLFIVGSGFWYFEVWKLLVVKRLICVLMNESGLMVMVYVVYLKWILLGVVNFMLCCILVIFFKLIIVNV